MSPELDQMLCERYPKIFAQRHASIRETCMAWGFTCGDGWFELINKLCADLQRMTDEEGAPQVVAVQVKEKFGTLCFYVDCATEVQFELISQVEGRSARVCETCGAPGKTLIKGGWFQTRCAEHAQQDAITLAEYAAARRASRDDPTA